MAADLQRKGYVGKTIRQIAGLCLKRVPLTQRLRLLGVREGSLAKARETDLYESNRPPAPVLPAQSAINSIATTDQLF